MIFLSHSSKDKESYVEYIADKIGKDRCVYDLYTFESGGNTIEEMLKNLDKSDLFVIFLSNNSLESKNVLFELEEAKERLQENRMKKIFPIIIDENITYKDPRIPEWLRGYNLKPILRKAVAYRRIVAKALEIQYELQPILKLKKNIFVGRNSLIQKFEEVSLNYSEEISNTFIASGIEKIGRTSFLRACFEKTKIVDTTYQAPIIELDGHQSLEDFIIKIADLGFSKEIDLKNFLTKSTEEKTVIALNLIKEINSYQEKIFIKDKGAIILPNGNIVEWFKEIISQLNEQVTFAISSKFRLNFSSNTSNKIIDFPIPELTIQERKNLLSYCLKIEEIVLSKEDFDFIIDLLTGYPEQINYAVAIIKKHGIKHLKEKSDLLIKYNSDRATLLLRKYEEEEEKRQFLILLSKFDYISVDFLFEIIEDNTFASEMLKVLYYEGIIEYIGATQEYLRLNDTIRDYVTRLSINISPKYRENLKKHIDSFLNSYKNEDKGAADFFFSIREALLEGKNIDSAYLIPSHFLKTMVELYNIKKDYKQVIMLADRVLENSNFLDPKILQEIRYYLCLSLVRIRSDRFMKEKNNISDIKEREFLLGFFHRVNGEADKAIEHFQKALKLSPNFSRAKREIVQAYLNVEDYESAYEIAKENYENAIYFDNAYHIQAYLKCVIKKEKTEENKKIVEILLQDLKKIPSNTAKEMYSRGEALYSAYFLENYSKALSSINVVIQEFPRSFHAFLEKFDIVHKYGSIKEIEDTITEFKKKCEMENKHKKNLELQMLVKLEIKKGNKELAKIHLNSIRGYPQDQLKKLEKQITNL